MGEATVMEVAGSGRITVEAGGVHVRHHPTPWPRCRSLAEVDDVAAAVVVWVAQVRGGGVVVDAGGQDIKSGGLRVDGGEEAGSMSMCDVHTETVGVLLGCLAGRSG